MKSRITDFYYKYKDLDNILTSRKLSKDKWSLKEIIGHLIDSGSNNHQRFIRFQIDEVLDFPDYKREEWLAVVDYNAFDFHPLISLLYYNTLFIVRLLEKVDAQSLEKQ